ncbi:MAG: Ig-like domain repeat protein [Verrucomicrobiota bacterium]|nr:Ig-like domain repeat protein [Verrucomicrobiota bacterium]
MTTSKPISPPENLTCLLQILIFKDSSDAWTFTDATGNYNDASGTVHDAIAPAPSTTVVTINGGPFTYTGAAITPATVTVTGAGGLSLTPNPVYANNLNAGTATASYTYAGDANHTGSADSKDFAIAKANATITVTPYDVTYDGNGHTATGKATGVNNEDLTSELDLSDTTHTNASDYPSDQWNFTDLTGNYNNTNGIVLDVITARALTVTATGVNKVYDGTTNATVTLSDDRLSGDTFSDSYASASFADPSVGDNKLVTVTGISISGPDAGNYSLQDTTTTTTADITPPPITTTTTSVASSANPAVLGASVTFTATVTASVDPTPTGTVTFYDGATPLGTNTLDGSGQATFSTSALAIGPHNITAFYGGGAGFSSSSNSLTQVVQYEPAGFVCGGNPGHTILPPIKVDGTSVFKQGSTVPAKFQVFDANCNSIGTPGVVSSFWLAQVINGTASADTQTVTSTTPDTSFRWDSTAKQWIFNISTKSLAKNATYVFTITLNDGTTIPFGFGLK